MSARQNFYTNVFEQIRGYKENEDVAPHHRGFLGDHLVQLSLVASVLIVVVFGGYVVSYPKFLNFSNPNLSTFITEQKFIASRLFSADRSFAADGSVTFNGLPVKTTDDSYVDSDSPDKPFGSEGILRVSASPERVSYVKFKIPDNITFSKAMFYITTDGSAPTDIDVNYIADNIWSKNLLTYTSRPIGGGENIGKFVPASDNQLSVNASKYVKPGAVISFSITKKGGSESVFASSEAGSGIGPVIILSQ